MGGARPLDSFVDMITSVYPFKDGRVFLQHSLNSL